MKPETRNPKAEGNPKAEIRSSTLDAQASFESGSRRELCGELAVSLIQTLSFYTWLPAFGFRSSDFGLLSGFGLRYSGSAS